MISIENGQTLYRVSANAENFLAAANAGVWGLNAKNRSEFDGLKEGDVILFYAKSQDTLIKNVDVTNGLAGWARVGAVKGQKRNALWLQEFHKESLQQFDLKKFKSDFWPFVFDIEDIHFVVPDSTLLNLDKNLFEKDQKQIRDELRYLYENLIPLATINVKLKATESNNFNIHRSINTFQKPRIVLDVINELLKQYKFSRVDVPFVGVDDLGEMEFYRPLLDDAGVDNPGRTKRITYSKNRKSKYAKKVKGIYNGACQVCGKGVLLPDGRYYSEAAHIKPIGEPHNGPDKVSNLLSLCPNHHKAFDNFSIRIGDDLKILDITGDYDGKDLIVDKVQHSLDKEFIKYHREWVESLS